MVKKSLQTARGQIYYWINTETVDVTSKRTIFCCHGLTADHTLFDKQISYFEHDYGLVIWDMPLHGESRPYSDFSFRHVAEDMKAILDAEGVTKVALIGQSAGGYACQAFALCYPDMVSAFISVDSTPFGKAYYKKSELFWTNHYSDIAKWYPYENYCKLSAKSATYTQESRESFYESLVRLGKKDMLKAADLYYKDFIHYEEVPFACPVLLLLGEVDNVGYVTRYSEAWAKRTGYPLLRIPNASHNSNYDNPTFFNQTVHEFLKQSEEG